MLSGQVRMDHAQYYFYTNIRLLFCIESKQIGLIDSIFRNFYIPPVVFAVTKEDGEDVRVCVDGKQRLTSIQKFFDGQASQTSFPAFMLFLLNGFRAY
jgi:hypothetical protein